MSNKGSSPRSSPVQTTTTKQSSTPSPSPKIKRRCSLTGLLNSAMTAHGPNNSSGLLESPGLDSRGSSSGSSKGRSLKDRLSLSLHGKRGGKDHRGLAKTIHGHGGGYSRPGSSSSSSSNKSKNKLSLSLHGLARSMHGSRPGSSSATRPGSSSSSSSNKNKNKLSLSLHGLARSAHGALPGIASRPGSSSSSGTNNSSNNNKKGLKDKLSLSLHGSSKHGSRRRRASMLGGRRSSLVGGADSPIAAAAAAKAAAAAAAADGGESGNESGTSGGGRGHRRRRSSLVGTFGRGGSSSSVEEQLGGGGGGGGEGKNNGKGETKTRRRSSLLKEEMMKKILEQANKVKSSFEKKMTSGSANKTSGSSSSSGKGVQHSAFQPYAAFGNTASVPTAPVILPGASRRTLSTRRDSSCTSIGIASTAASAAASIAASGPSPMMMDPVATAEQLNQEWQEITAAQAAGGQIGLARANASLLVGGKRGSFTLGTCEEDNTTSSTTRDRRGSFRTSGRRNSGGYMSSTSSITAGMRRASLNSRSSSVNSLSINVQPTGRTTLKDSSNSPLAFDFHEEGVTSSGDVNFNFTGTFAFDATVAPDTTTSLEPTASTLRQSSEPVTSSDNEPNTMTRKQRRRRASICGTGSGDSNGSNTNEAAGVIDISTHAEYSGLSRQEMLVKLYQGGRGGVGRRRRSAGDAELDSWVDGSMPRKRQSASSNLDVEEVQNMDLDLDDDETAAAGSTSASVSVASSTKPDTTTSSSSTTTGIVQEYKPDRRVFHRSKRGQHLEETHDWLPAKQMGVNDNNYDDKRQQEAEASRVLIKYQARVNPQDCIMLNAPPYEQIELNSNDVVAMMNTGVNGSRLHELMTILIGNRRFLVLLEMHYKKYSKAKTAQYRTKEARSIVQAIHHAIPQGRFITVDTSGIWTVMPPLWSIHYVERALSLFSFRKQGGGISTAAKSA